MSAVSLELAPGLHCGDRLPLAVIAGTCVVESRVSALTHALALQKICAELQLPLVFKASYDKANRTSHHSYRGPGVEEGLAVLSEVKRETGLPLLTDVHTPEQCQSAARVVDILQIPAFLCRQTDLLMAAAACGRTVNVKKGQFLSPHEAQSIVSKLRAGGAERIVLTERGSSFGYNNLVADMRAIPIMRGFGVPVVFDATHSVQRPGALGTATGGDAEFIPVLARAAVAAGADAIFLEVHEDPSRALSDGPNALRLDKVRELLVELRAIRRAIDR